MEPSQRSTAALAATGTDGKPIRKRVFPLLPQSGDGAGRFQTLTDVMTDSNAPILMMRSSLENEALDASVRFESDRDAEEAPPGFEPGIKVLQTSALPLGYGARMEIQT
jgi:hypothetical protein